MLIVIVALIFLLIELFIALGVLASVTVQACAIIGLVGFAIVLVLALISGPISFPWGKAA
jgi:hypothetical protein